MQEILLRTACLTYPSRVGALRSVLRHAYLAVFIRRMKGSAFRQLVVSVGCWLHVWVHLSETSAEFVVEYERCERGRTGFVYWTHRMHVWTMHACGQHCRVCGSAASAPPHCLRTPARVSEESRLEYACGALRGVAGQWLDCLLCLECVMLSTHFSAW